MSCGCMGLIMFLPVCAYSAYRNSRSDVGLVRLQIAFTDAITLCHLNKRNALTHCGIPKQQKMVNHNGEQ